MEIKNKFNIGDKVWVIYENQGEISIYNDTIDEICIRESGIYYILKEACIDKEEKNLVLYLDREGLLNKIYEIMQEIRKKEGKENGLIKKMEI